MLISLKIRVTTSLYYQQVKIFTGNGCAMTIPSKFHKQTLTRHHKRSFQSITSIDGYKTREMNFEKRSNST